MANVTGITKISYAKGLGGLSSSINYVTQPTPHNSAHGVIKHRALAIHGFNCPDSPTDAYNAMKGTLNHNYINHTNITCIRDIQSFKGLNFQSKKDRKLALKLDTEFIKRAFPHNQSLIVLQADGKHHYLHCHNIICDRRLDNGKSIAHYANFKNLASQFDKILIKNGYTPLHHGKLRHSDVNRNRGTFYHYQHDKSFILMLSSKIHKSLKYSYNSTELSNNLKHCGVQLERFKMTKINGKREPKLYTQATRGGLYKRLSNGKYLRFRKHFSYAFKFHNKKIIIRDRKLGTNYSVKSLLNILHTNKQYLMSKKSQYQPNYSTYIAPNNVKINSHIFNHSIPLSYQIKHWNNQEKSNVNKQQQIMNKYNQNQAKSEAEQKKLDFATEFINLMIKTNQFNYGYNGITW